MRKVFSAAFIVLGLTLLTAPSLAGTRSTVFPPSDCSPLRPLIAWDGSGNTYCIAIPTCASGQVLTSTAPGQLSCYTLPVLTVKTASPSDTSVVRGAITPSDTLTPLKSEDTSTPTTSNACTASDAVCSAYSTAVGRLPEEAGANYWSAREAVLRSQNPSASTTQISSLLVKEMSGTAEYKDVRGTAVSAEARAQEQAGQASFASHFDTTTADPCAGATNCGGNSAPATNAVTQEIADMYRSYLGREPDPAGLAYWVNQATSSNSSDFGATMNGIANSIANSPEAQGR